MFALNLLGLVGLALAYFAFFTWPLCLAWMLIMLLKRPMRPRLPTMMIVMAGVGVFMALVPYLDSSHFKTADVFRIGVGGACLGCVAYTLFWGAQYLSRGAATALGKLRRVKQALGGAKQDDQVW